MITIPFDPLPPHAPPFGLKPPPPPTPGVLIKLEGAITFIKSKVLRSLTIVPPLPPAL